MSQTLTSNSMFEHEVPHCFVLYISQELLYTEHRIGCLIAISQLDYFKQQFHARYITKRSQW